MTPKSIVSIHDILQQNNLFSSQNEIYTPNDFIDSQLLLLSEQIGESSQNTNLSFSQGNSSSLQHPNPQGNTC